MASRVSVEFLALFLAGILAGEEFVIRYGVRDAIGTLDDVHHIELRQALIYRLRVLVPSIYFPALVLAVAATVIDGAQAGVAARCVGVALLVAWILLTIFGTVPINAAAFSWDPGAPPGNWRAVIDRWERLNTIRTWTAVAAFAALLTGTALRLG